MNVTARRGRRDHTPIFLAEETESQSPALWQNLPVTSADLSQSSGSGVPHQPSSFRANPLLPALVLLEVRGNGVWAPFLDSRALSWEPGLLPQRDSHRASSSPASPTLSSASFAQRGHGARVMVGCDRDGRRSPSRHWLTGSLRDRAGEGWPSLENNYAFQGHAARKTCHMAAGLGFLP